MQRLALGILSCWNNWAVSSIFTKSLKEGIHCVVSTDFDGEIRLSEFELQQRYVRYQTNNLMKASHLA